MTRAGQRKESVWVWLVASALTVPVGCSNEPEDTPDEELAESLAHDIDIALVELNQGVAIPIAREGVWIAPHDRTAPVVMGREAIVRVHWTVEPEFEARPITVRLVLERSDLDEPSVIEQPEMIGADGFADLAIPAADMLPGLRFRVELLEQDPAYAELPPPTIAPVSPRDLESAPIGVRLEPTALKLVLVPLTLQWSGCSTSVDLEALAQLYDDMAFQKSPTQALTTEVREPLVITTAPASIVDLLEPVQQLRAAEQGDLAAYYLRGLRALRRVGRRPRRRRTDRPPGPRGRLAAGWGGDLQRRSTAQRGRVHASARSPRGARPCRVPGDDGDRSLPRLSVRERVDRRVGIWAARRTGPRSRACA